MVLLFIDHVSPWIKPSCISPSHITPSSNINEHLPLCRFSLIAADHTSRQTCHPVTFVFLPHWRRAGGRPRHSGGERLYRCFIHHIRIICLPQQAAFCVPRMCLPSLIPCLCVCVCAQGCLWGRNPASSRVIRHAALVTGNGVADGQAECIIDECHALAAPSPRRISLNFLSEWQKKPRTISLIRSICLTAPYPFNPPIQSSV